MIALCRAARTILEPNVVKVTGPAAAAIGDCHGQFPDLKRAIRQSKATW